MLVPYQDGETVLEGFAVLPQQEKRPLVLLCHAWRGRDPFICEKAELVASWGYAAFAIDMYGKGVLGNSKEQNAALKKPFVQDRDYLRKRVLKGYEKACTLPGVDPRCILVLGFGFGALCALALAQCAVPLQGAISVYGHYDFPSDRPIEAPLLLLHGLNDPVSPPETLLEFQRAHPKTDCQIHFYSQTLHAFASPSAQDAANGLLYNPVSSARAWTTIQSFVGERAQRTQGT